MLLYILIWQNFPNFIKLFKSEYKPTNTKELIQSFVNTYCIIY